MAIDKILEQRVNYRSSKSDSFKNTLVCWRQHPAIHYWMQNLQNARYGEDENKKIRTYVKLCEYDILALKSSILRGTLNFNYYNKTIGRSYKNDKEQEKLDLKFIELALDSLRQGKELVYQSYFVDKDEPINCEVYLGKIKNKISNRSPIVSNPEKIYLKNKISRSPAQKPRSKKLSRRYSSAGIRFSKSGNTSGVFMLD